LLPYTTLFRSRMLLSPGGSRCEYSCPYICEGPGSSFVGGVLADSVRQPAVAGGRTRRPSGLQVSSSVTGAAWRAQLETKVAGSSDVEHAEMRTWHTSISRTSGRRSAGIDATSARPSARRDSQTSRRLQRGLVACSATPEGPRPNWKSSRLYVERGLI